MRWTSRHPGPAARSGGTLTPRRVAGWRKVLGGDIPRGALRGGAVRDRHAQPACGRAETRNQKRRLVPIGLDTWQGGQPIPRASLSRRLRAPARATLSRWPCGARRGLAAGTLACSTPSRMQQPPAGQPSSQQRGVMHGKLLAFRKAVGGVWGVRDVWERTAAAGNAGAAAGRGRRQAGGRHQWRCSYAEVSSARPAAATRLYRHTDTTTIEQSAQRDAGSTH